MMCLYCVSNDEGAYVFMAKGFRVLCYNVLWILDCVYHLHRYLKTAFYLVYALSLTFEYDFRLFSFVGYCGTFKKVQLIVDSNIMILKIMNIVFFK